jgi:hypothetical protein
LKQISEKDFAKLLDQKGWELNALHHGQQKAERRGTRSGAFLLSECMRLLALVARGCAMFIVIAITEHPPILNIS